MSGCHNPYSSYYGTLENNSPIRALSHDLAKENKLNMIQAIKESEERIKRHITECKREVIKELQSMQDMKVVKDVMKKPKGEKNGK